LELENNLRKLRFEHDAISQQELANAVGVTRLTIHSIENKKFNPSTTLALRLADFFKVRVEDIFYLVKETNEK
jgi:putative transcriptional regulator